MHYWGGQILTRSGTVSFIKEHSAAYSSLAVCSPLRKFFFYVNGTAVRSTKAVYGFSKLSYQTDRCGNLQVRRFVARGQFGKIFISFVM
jgi:hypothetical protein